MLVAAWIAAAGLVVAGLVGVVVPVLPGPLLIFAGLLLAAWADGFAHVGPYTLTLLGALAALAYVVDFAAGALGAKGLGASWYAVGGAAIGAVVGLPFGLVGILAGPLVGAVAGELAARGDMLHAGRAGVGAWLGLVIGAAFKLAISFAMLGVFAVALWVSRPW